MWNREVGLALVIIMFFVFVLLVCFKSLLCGVKDICHCVRLNDRPASASACIPHVRGGGVKKTEHGQACSAPEKKPSTCSRCSCGKSKTKKPLAWPERLRSRER